MEPGKKSKRNIMVSVEVVDPDLGLGKISDDIFLFYDEEGKVVEWEAEHGKGVVVFTDHVDYGSMVEICEDGVRRMFCKKTHKVIEWKRQGGKTITLYERSYKNVNHIALTTLCDNERFVFDIETHEEVALKEMYPCCLGWPEECFCQVSA